MTLKEKEIGKDKSHSKIVITNNNGDYIIYKRQHEWHNLTISKIMKKDIDLFLNESSRTIFLKLQKIAKRQGEIRDYLSKFEREKDSVFGKMFKSKYYQQQEENMLKAEELLIDLTKSKIKDFFEKENDGLTYIKNIYVEFLTENRWFEAICFYLLCSLKIKSFIYLDVDVKLSSGDMVQIDDIFISKDYCVLIECKSGENSKDNSDFSKIKFYKESFNADYGILMRCKENAKHQIREKFMGVFVLDGIFSKDSKEIKENVKKILLGS